jgi:hypothetical protein
MERTATATVAAACIALLAAPGAAAQSVEETLTIGVVDGPPEQTFERIAAVHATSDGRIVVVDEGDASIRVFGSGGKFLARFGGTGEGPAEFRHVGAAALSGDTLTVLDRNGGKLVRFTLGGELIDTRRTDFAVSAHGFPLRMNALRDGALIVETASGCSIPPREGTDTQWRLLRIEPDGPALTELRKADVGGRLAVYGRGASFCTVIPLPFRPGPVAAVHRDGTVAFGTGTVPQVEMHDVGEDASRRIIELPGSRRSFGRADRRGWRDVVLGERLGPDTPDDVARRLREVEDEIEFPGLWPAYDRMFYDSNGDLWIRRPAAFDAAEAEWDVLEPDGAFRATVALPAALVVHAVSDGRVYGVMKGEWDEDRVRRYDIRWR